MLCKCTVIAKESFSLYILNEFGPRSTSSLGGKMLFTIPINSHRKTTKNKFLMQFS